MPVDLASLIVDVADFPKPGGCFKDITPPLATGGTVAATADLVARLAAHGLTDITALVTIEAA